ncbi:LCP family glycopolymer transferase [Paenibacillus glucanolyticus]|uniref:LCP family glycopolymer transferase n=1 Tax=Paenibacillus glucanolyticus TaxID=59843 RepID=UPI0034CE0288
MKMRRKWLLWLLALLILLPSAYILYTYQSIKSTADQIYEERKPTPVVPTIVYDRKPIQVGDRNMKDPDPFTILVLGVDQRPHDSGRSDVMILMAVNPSKGSMLLFNIPRDTRTDIIGHGTVDKINHAYAFGGIEMSVSSVENFLQIPIDYYIKVDMEGFSSIIDSLGGVTVDNKMRFEYGGYTFDPGVLNLNGDEALSFSRMRFEDPKGDLGRNSRQREVLKGILNKVLRISTVFKLESLLDNIGSSVKTDISFEEMKLFVTEHRQKLQKIEQVEIAGHGQRIDGIWYYIVGDKEREEIISTLRTYME